jgi:tRNA threonylcarbamoyladenosine biosynthesis protein TsaE
LNTVYCKNIADVKSAARQLMKLASDEKIWVFKGQMGAGKTTLIKSIAEEFGIKEKVSSPTFSLVNEYQNDKNETFYHFDFYRVDLPEEVLEIGIDEYFYSGNYCWIEWAERIPEFVPNNFLLIEITVKEDDSREIVVKHV